jgi:hypothetical protein
MVTKIQSPHSTSKNFFKFLFRIEIQIGTRVDKVLVPLDTPIPPQSTNDKILVAKFEKIKY